jgi:hypothetical protein
MLPLAGAPVKHFESIYIHVWIYAIASACGPAVRSQNPAGPPTIVRSQKETSRSHDASSSLWLLASVSWLLASYFWLLSSCFWLLASGFLLLSSVFSLLAPASLSSPSQIRHTSSAPMPPGPREARRAASRGNSP